MAKVGNEAKLILRLALEKADKEFQQRKPTRESVEAGTDSNFNAGLRSGLQWYANTLEAIVAEMEGRHAHIPPLL